MTEKKLNPTVSLIVNALNELLFMREEELMEVVHELNELKWMQEIRRYEKGMFLGGVAEAIKEAFLDEVTDEEEDQ